MRLREYVRFLVGFSREDLFAPGALLPTATNILCNTSVLFVCLTGLAVVDGAANVRRKALERDQENLCIRGGQANIVGRIDASFLADLRKAFEAAPNLDGGRAIRVLAPYSQTRQRRWIAKNGSSSDPIKGRTFRDGDLLIQNRPPRAWKDPSRKPPPADPLACSNRGVYVTESMLAELGYGKPSPQEDGFLLDEEPQELLVELRFGLPAYPVPVLGISERPLPDGYQFVWSEAFLQWLEKYELQGNEQVEDPFKTGPVPPSWIDALATDSLPESVKQWITLKIEDSTGRGGPQPSQRPDGKSCWKFGRSGEAYQFWAENLDEIRRRMVDGGFNKATDHAPDLVPPPPGFTLKPCDAGLRPNDEFVAVYARDLDDLDAIARIMASEPFALNPNRDIARKLREIGRQSRVLLNVLWAIVVLILLMACGSAFSLDVLRADSRKAETGMLRAIGMSRRVLIGVSVTESLLQWLVALAVAAALLFLLKPFIPGWLYDDPLDQPHALVFEWRMMVRVIVVSCLVAVSTGLAATWGARNAEPAEMVRSR